MSNLFAEYNRAKEWFEICLAGEGEVKPGRMILILMGLGDCYFEMQIIEELMLNSLEGLA